MSERRLAVLGVLVGLTALVLALVAVRVIYTQSLEKTSLAWNLVLAWIPFLLAVFLYDRVRRGAATHALAVPGILWLLFFPNAPYIVTDFKHLDESYGLAYWYDLALIATVAATGLLLGFVSLYLVQAVVRRAVDAKLSWAFVVVVLALSSFGIYLGRILRWNSWDPIARPHTVAGDLASAIASPEPRMLAFTFIFTVFLSATYVSFYVLARFGIPRERRDW
jgi:uncharacterized membrane protein